MKKSIFLFFAAILCATNAWGAKLFFDHSSVNYPADGALVAIWSWGGSSPDAWSVFKASGATNKIVADIADGRTGGKIVRFNSSVTTPDWNASQWNSTGDIKSFPSDKNCIKITSWDGATSGTWTKFQLESQASITPSASSVSVGEEVTFTPALTSNQEYNDVLSTTYSVGAGATITNGKFVATEAGTYTVTATVTYNAQGYTNITKTATATCSILVSAVAVPHPVTGVTIAPTSVTIKQGATATLTATVSPSNADDPSITWSSDNTSVATVVNGVVTAVAAGTANITVTTVDGGFTATCAVKVKPSQYTFYAINSAQWPTVAAHYWGGADGGSSWPGADMVKESETINGFNIYSITISSDFTNIMFTNKIDGDNNKKTADLTTEGNNGKYYDIKGAKWYASLSEVPVSYDYYIAGTEAMTGHNWNPVGLGIEDNDGDGIYSHTFTLNAGGDYQFKVTQDNDWDPNWGYSKLDKAYDGVTNSGDDGENIKINLTETKTITVHFDSKAGSISLEGLDSQDKVTYDYYIAGTLPGAAWNPASLGMTKEGDVYKATFSELPAETYEFKITDGQWNSEGDATHEHTTLGAAYEEVSYNEGNIQIVTEEAINLTVIFNAATDKITFEGLTEKAPAEPVTVYFINSGNWAEVACYYWGGIEAATWPGAKMTANGEVFEAEGWNVYKITFPGDNTKCIFTDNKAEGATQTADLQVENGKYYCYANGIWYERLADVDPLDTRVYLKGQMNEWCDAGYCYMFRKETIDGTVAYSNVYLEEAHTTYEFKIEDAGAWLSNTGTMTKDNCTDWTFEESVSDNAKITTEYVGEYTFVWDMTTKKLSVVYPDPKANPEVMDLMVTDMVFDGNKTFSGTDNMMGIVFNLVVGDETDEEGVFALDASSTVNFGGTLFTDVTGMIAPDTETFASASAVVYGFYMGMYCQLNVEMSAGGAAGVSVEILDGTASVNGAGELWITGQWEGDDVYVQVPGFEGESYECDEAWFYVGGTTVETASIIAFGPVTITVEGNDVTVEGTVMSGATFTSYDLLVIGTFPAAPETYTRTVTNGQWGTICLPNASSSFTGATFYEVSSLVYGEGLWLDKLAAGAQLVAGKPYIFQATATEIVVTYTGAAVGAPIEGANGLTGTFEDIEDGSLDGHYIIANNAVYVAGAEATLPANRAYINAEDVPTTTQAEIPGRRRVLMGENAATGVDNIVAPEGQAVKAIVNGQLIIIRDGVKYNVQGQKL